MKPHVVVIGSANTDLVVRVPKLPSPGETVTGRQFQIVAGGKGANQAVAAARAGARVAFIGSLGPDNFGKAILRGLRREGIDTRYVVRSEDSPSGVALIMVDARGENLIGVARGSNDELLPKHIDAAASFIDSARCLVVQLEIPLATVRHALKLAVLHNVPVLLNPAPARRVPATLLRQITFLTPNEGELGALTGLPVKGKSAVEAATQRLHNLGVKHVLATCGARGVCWRSAVGARWYSAPRVRAVDTVGAGDCFSGAFAAAMTEGKTVEEAVRFAIAAAAISVTRPGAQTAMPRRREILRSLAACWPGAGLLFLLPFAHCLCKQTV
ncbi:MAG TPA: ribokinase [Candidatus Angelobacter sp.]|nr:ribokinase [Candidatus Angelobacter sp.]